MPNRLILVALSAALLGPPMASGQQHLPTPYTADQIRDAFPQGLQILMRVTTPAGTSFSKMVVQRWSPDEVTMSEQAVDEAGRPIGPQTVATATWVELRDHASFSAETAIRRRAIQTTPLGSLEGWLYMVREGEESVSEFFFADAFPGPPILFSQSQTGTAQLRAEMIERSGG